MPAPHLPAWAQANPLTWSAGVRTSAEPSLSKPLCFGHFGLGFGDLRMGKRTLLPSVCQNPFWVAHAYPSTAPLWAILSSNGLWSYSPVLTQSWVSDGDVSSGMNSWLWVGGPVPWVGSKLSWCGRAWKGHLPEVKGLSSADAGGPGRVICLRSQVPRCLSFPSWCCTSTSGHTGSVSFHAWIGIAGWGLPWTAQLSVASFCREFRLIVKKNKKLPYGLEQCGWGDPMVRVRKKTTVTLLQWQEPQGSAQMPCAGWLHANLKTLGTHLGTVELAGRHARRGGNPEVCKFRRMECHPL